MDMDLLTDASALSAKLDAALAHFPRSGKILQSSCKAGFYTNHVLNHLKHFHLCSMKTSGYFKLM